MGKILYGMTSPHPPLLVPQIGGGRIKDVEKTKKSLEQCCKKVRSLKPDTIIMITPHGETSLTTPHIYTGHVFEGDLSAFGASRVRISRKGDPELGLRILKESQAANILTAGIQESFLDHGIMVPLYYLNAAGVNVPILPIAISFSPLSELFKFGNIIKAAVQASGKNAVIVASADMSHRLTADAPSGYDPNGKIFDEKLVDLVSKNDVTGMIGFDRGLAEQAGQDALGSIAILLGAIDGSGFKSNVMSYEGPFGVGYMVAEFALENK